MKIELNSFTGWWPSADPYNAPKGSLLRMDNMVLDDFGALRPRMGARVLYETAAVGDATSIYTASVSAKTVTLVQYGTKLYGNALTPGAYGALSLLEDMGGTGPEAAYGSYMDQVFFGSGTRRGRAYYNGATLATYNWGINVKPGTPTVAAAAQVTFVVATCASAESPAFSAAEGTITGTYPTGYDGTANGAIEVTPDATTGRATITKTFASDQDMKDFSSTTGSDSDLFDMMVWIAEPEKIEVITVMFGMQGATDDYFRDDYYFFDFRLGGTRQGTVDIKAVDGARRQVRSKMSTTAEPTTPTQPEESPSLDRAEGIDDIIERRPRGELRSRERHDKSTNPGWTHLTVTRGQFNRIGATTGRTWKTIRSFRLVVKTVAGATGAVRFDNVVFVGDGEAALTGAFRFKVVPVCQAGNYEDRGQASEPSAEIILNQQRAEVTIPQATFSGMDAQTTKFWIYAFGGFLDKYYKCAEVTIPTPAADKTTTIAKSDIQMLIDNVPLEFTQPAPQNIIGIDGPYKFRIFALTSEGYLYPSQRRRPGSFNYAHAIKIGDTSNKPLWVKRTALGLYIGTNKDIYVLTGEGTESDGIADFRLDPLSVADPPIDRCVTAHGNSIFYHAARGFYELSGGVSTRLPHERIEVLMTGAASTGDGVGTASERYGVEPIPSGESSDTNVYTFRMTVHNGYLLILVPPAAGASAIYSYEDRFVYRHKLGTDQWERHVYPLNYDLANIITDVENRVFACGADGRILWLYSYLTSAPDHWQQFPVDEDTAGTYKSIMLNVIWPYVDGGLSNQYKYMLDYHLRLAAYSKDAVFNFGFKIDSDDNSGNYWGSAAPVLLPSSNPSDRPAMVVYRNKLATPPPPALAIQPRLWVTSATVTPITARNAFALESIIINTRDEPQLRMRVDTGYLIPEADSTAWVRRIRAMIRSNVNLTCSINFDDGTSEAFTITVTVGKTMVYDIPLPKEKKGGLPRVQIYTSGSDGADTLAYSALTDVMFACYWIEYQVDRTGLQNEKKHYRVTP